MKRAVWLAVAFLVLAATMPPQCNGGGGGGNPPQPVMLTEKVRPLQGGTQVDVAYWDDINESYNRGTCTYAVFVRDIDYDSATYDQVGLLTADHCAYRRDAAIEDNLTATGQDVWQSFEGDDGQTDRIVAWVTRRAPFKWWYEDGCQAFDDAGNGIEYCQIADALFAKLEPGEDLSDAGLANVPLSTDHVELQIDDPDDYQRYVGAQNAPFSNSLVYKIGRTTGKTRGIVTQRRDSVTVRSAKFSELRINYNVYVVTPEDSVPMSQGGDSGAPVLYQNPASMGPDEYDLVGIVVAGANGTMFMDPWGDIRDELNLTVTNGY